MVRTRVGYAGGTTRNPTYENLGDHTETVQIDYDPSRVSYAHLLEIFWESHNPAVKPWSKQYKAIVFYHDDEQKRLATESGDSLQVKLNKPVYTEFVPYSRFHLAEDYHQKFYLQGVKELAGEYRAIYPSNDDFVTSTAVARVNGYAGGYGSYELLDREMKSLGLSEAGQRKLLEIARDLRAAGSSCPVIE